MAVVLRRNATATESTNAEKERLRLALDKAETTTIALSNNINSLEFQRITLASKIAELTNRPVAGELADARTERDAAVSKAADEVKRANAAIELQKKAASERDSARHDLAAWTALGVPLENVKATLLSLREVSVDRDVLAGEKKLLLAENRRLNEKIKSILDPEYNVPLPEGLKGTVLVTDPQYDFLVLNLGKQQGALEGGKMLVTRQGRLVAKVRIKSVQNDRCIAETLPGWKLGDIKEGDQVIN